MAVKLFSCLLCFLFLVMLFSPGSHASLNGACMGLPPGHCGRKVERSRKINFHVRMCVYCKVSYGLTLSFIHLTQGKSHVMPGCFKSPDEMKSVV